MWFSKLKAVQLDPGNTMERWFKRSIGGREQRVWIGENRTERRAEK